MDNKKEKTCFKCGELKPLSEYYEHSQMRDGHLNKCKICTRLDAKKRVDRLKVTNPEWVFNEKERCRLKSVSSVGKKYERVWIDMDVKKSAATAASSIKVPQGFQRHHWSYNKSQWKDIIPLTIKDHAKVHRYTKYDSERLMYRTIHGVLLDTRGSAEHYYSKVLSIRDGVYSELEKLK